MGPIKLLIFQGTPFCNIDCSYCYLPDRTSTKRLHVSTVAATLDKVLNEHLVGDDLEILWHCGEPLVLPVDIYDQFFLAIDEKLRSRSKYTLAIQTNGTLLSEKWCSFLKRWNVKVGISIDGPKNLHDSNRKDRQGQGTFEGAIRGLRLLQSANISCYIIAVIGSDSLTRPTELHDFFLSTGVRQICFNVEEVDGIHLNSSLQDPEMDSRVENFFLSYFRLVDSPGSYWLREYEHTLRALFSQELANSMVTPFEMLTVDHAGNYSTFSPELLNARMPDGRLMQMGNVHDSTLSFESALRSAGDWTRAIASGVERCRSTCSFFDMCGGGSPSNKLAEHGDFDTTETVFCRMGTQAPLRAMIRYLQEKLSNGSIECVNPSAAIL